MGSTAHKCLELNASIVPAEVFFWPVNVVIKRLSQGCVGLVGEIVLMEELSETCTNYRSKGT